MKDVKYLVSLIVGVILLCLLIFTGTYAALTYSISVSNEVVNGTTGCFDVDYGIGEGSISGTLFQTQDHVKGINGSVSLNTQSGCPTGIGRLVLNVDSTVSSVLTQVVSNHCEETGTLVSHINYTTESSCTGAGYSWITGGSALKYAIFSDSEATTRLSSGYITATDIGKRKDILTNIEVNTTVKNFYVYIWLDGNLADNTYVELPFSGSIAAQVIQN